jgi:tetratricopeptide (TPR) repeat protein
MQIGLPSGRYNVTAVKDNLKQMQTANISQGMPVELSFQLSPTSGLTPEQAKAQAETQAMAQQAIEAMRAGRDDEAITKFNEIVAKIPTCSDCYYNLGVAYSKKQQFTEAEAAFTKATELAPNNADAYTGLANVYNAQKKFDQAQQASAKAAQLAGAGGGGGSAEAVYNQGVILWNAGKYAEAKEQFEAAVKADPNMAMAHYQLGMANLNLGQIPAARQAFEGYLKVDPNGPKAGEVQTFLKQLPQYRPTGRRLEPAPRTVLSILCVRSRYLRRGALARAIHVFNRRPADRRSLAHYCSGPVGRARSRLGSSHRRFQNVSARSRARRVCCRATRFRREPRPGGARQDSGRARPRHPMASARSPADEQSQTRCVSLRHHSLSRWSRTAPEARRCGCE